MASKKTKAIAKQGESRPMGRPSLYRPEFCQMLVEHMGANPDDMALTFESFGAVIGVSSTVLYNWQKQFPEFRDAHRLGMAYAEQAIARNLYKMAKGQFTITYEKTFMTKEGVAYREMVTEPARTNAAALIFLAKNVCGWKDRREVSLTGDDDKPVTMRIETYDEKIERIEQLRKARQELAAHEATYSIIQPKEQDDARQPAHVERSE